MLFKTTNFPKEFETRSGFCRTGKLSAISAILLSASAGMSFGYEYPVSAIAEQSASLARPCTQLELSADMISAECGTLTLADVMSRMNASDTDKRDE